jgi:hypothetical protein
MNIVKSPNKTFSYGKNTEVGYIIKKRQGGFPNIKLNNLEKYNRYNNKTYENQMNKFKPKTTKQYIINGTRKVNLNLKNKSKAVVNAVKKKIIQAY